MPTSDSSSSASFRAGGITRTIERALASAGLDASRGPLRRVTETIRRALGELKPGHAPRGRSAGEDDVIDLEPVVSPRPGRAPVGPGASPAPDVQAPGSFLAHEFSNAAGTRSFMLYVPARLPPGPRPLMVMLHGCTQSAADFAAGTRMNALAEENGFLVVYPEQPSQANPSKCWNWFERKDQARDGGEPSLIAGMVRRVMATHAVDPRRVFIAGLSAGAAMAVILGETYPDLFAGVGAHSGLPYGSAQDIPSALAAMKGGRSGLPGLRSLATASPGLRAGMAVPIIVFQGDRDHTVQASNSEEIVRQALDAHRREAGLSALASRTESGQAPGGRRYTRTIHADGSGRAIVESWTLHGAGHAWSGGDLRGTYTDANGPDASAAMTRFFLGLAPSHSA